jgi:aerobic-type carbon monoxide dehydrogenase small subunit (CoxS/CutS family)
MVIVQAPQTPCSQPTWVPVRLGVLQAAFRRHHALQCGFCTAGILMSLDAYLRHSGRDARRSPR